MVKALRMRRRRKDQWRRCWRGNLPRRKRILIYDSNEQLALVDSRKDRFFEHWHETTGGKIAFYCLVPRLPFETIPLWPEESDQKTKGATESIAPLHCELAFS
jgi:hypothetical protein